MLTTITIIISILVMINFALLVFSVNKIDKKPKENKTIVVLNSDFKSTAKKDKKLAPTGS